VVVALIKETPPMGRADVVFWADETDVVFTDTLLRNSRAADATAACDIKVAPRRVGCWTDLYRLLGCSSDRRGNQSSIQGGVVTRYGIVEITLFRHIW